MLYSKSLLDPETVLGHRAWGAYPTANGEIQLRKASIPPASILEPYFKPLVGPQDFLLSRNSSIGQDMSEHTGDLRQRGDGCRGSEDRRYPSRR